MPRGKQRWNHNMIVAVGGITTWCGDDGVTGLVVADV